MACKRSCVTVGDALPAGETKGGGGVLGGGGGSIGRCMPLFHTRSKNPKKGEVIKKNFVW